MSAQSGTRYCFKKRTNRPYEAMEAENEYNGPWFFYEGDGEVQDKSSVCYYYSF
jgi:hypothetical protein